MSTYPKPPIQPEADPGATKRSPWTSLEVAKFVASLATPFALVALSYFVSQQQKNQDRIVAEQQKHQDRVANEAVRATQRAADKAAQQREEAVRDQTERFQTALQDVALKSEAALRAEGIAREKDMRDEAFRREEAVRMQQLELVKVSKLAEKRIEFWEKLAPKLAQINLAIDNVYLKKGNADEVLKLFRESEDIFGLYKPYFSPKFVADYLIYKKYVLGFVALAKGPVIVGLLAGDGAGASCRQYITLRDSAAYEVAQATGLLDGSQGESSYQWAYAECDERENEAREEGKKIDQADSPQ